MIGLPGSGVKTTFSAITGHSESAGVFSHGGQNRVATLKIPDPRLDVVSRVYKPKKSTPASVEIVEFPGSFGLKGDSRVIGKAREADALVTVVRAFESLSVPHLEGSIDASRDFKTVQAEMLLADLAIVESRLGRLAASLQKRKNEEEEAEREVLVRCKECLDQGQQLSDLGLLPHDVRRIRGFGFLTLKPQLVLLNIGDSQLGQEKALAAPFQALGFETRALSASVEAELAEMEPEERAEFMAEFGVEELAAPIVLGAAYRALDVVTFYTYSEEECRAWTLHRGDTAVDAAGRIHTDLAQGFIRAEVVAYEDFEQLGDIKAAKAAGRFRLEGRDYVVQDGDLILIRHSG